MAIVDFPHPDSPTRPNVLPRGMSNETPRMASRHSVPIRYSKRRSSTVRTDSAMSVLVMAGLSRLEDLRDGVGKQVHSHHEGGDRQGGKQRRPPDVAVQEDIVAGDGLSPIGYRRVTPEAQERQRQGREDRISEPHGEF